ncbi:phosphotransferase [Heyndrickxia oleronia]|uniref:phosphotransferase n=1 Tax=Heyndrickxia oleronia TaxID=38875 RepID=UPI001C0F1908|nr:phosphotransferase [Heyndrickxia oleronia]MBU5210794.1 phosphotransferase [Heyndrickxia oleronia]
MEEKTCEQIKEDIFNTLKMRDKLDILSDKKINKGYLNYKWKIYTDKGNFFVKQYNKKRYPDEMLDGLERSLNQHAYLYENGIPCPKLFIYEKKYVQYSIGGERFVLMELKNGNMIEAGSATIDQMYSLGRNIGKMHKLLNKKRQVDLPLHWEIPSKNK